MLLLDSQVVLWVLDDSPRLGPQSRAQIDAATFVHFSAATVWELQIKVMLGKVDLPEDFVASILDAGLAELPVSAQHAAAIRDYPQLVRHDPFDRLLMAQAAQNGLRLITADRTLLETGQPFVDDARR